MKRIVDCGSVDINSNPVLKSETGNCRACPFIFVVSGNEFCELLALFGIGGNLVTYLTMKLHEGNVLGARNVTTWLGTCHLTPLIGAVMADAYWGRYRTIACFSIIHFMVRFILHKRKKNSLFVAYSYSVISPFIPDSFS
uniref:Uncharacterized protein n=1 Tax=Solanum lycopersicum TaxID=4081 RepID=A0A3Q7J9D0_SOLLC